MAESSIEELLPTRESLLSRLRDHEDSASWQAFFNTYWRLIYHTARKTGLNDQEAQEVVQETVIGVSREIGTFEYRREGGSFKSWLLKRAKWRIADQYRARARRETPFAEQFIEGEPPHVPELEQVDFEKIWQDEWEKNLLEAALEKVKQKTDLANFQIFELAALRDWPTAKVTQALGVSAARVYLVKHRVWKLLEQELRLIRANPTEL